MFAIILDGCGTLDQCTFGFDAESGRRPCCWSLGKIGEGRVEGLDR